MSDPNTGGWIQVYTGGKFHVFDPRPNEVSIEDIAHALSMLCRYGGHSSSFYSVAQHCVLVSKLCQPEDALWGLLHDAPEAYLIDLPRPIKRHPAIFEFYYATEERVMRAICDRFNLDYQQPDSVTWADKAIVSAERKRLMKPAPEEYDTDYYNVSIDCDIFPWNSRTAEQVFLSRFSNCAADAGLTI